MSECSAIVTFLAGRKLSRIGIDSERSNINTVDARVVIFCSFYFKVVWGETYGRALTISAYGIADSLFDVEVEVVSKLVRLCFVGPVRDQLQFD